MASFSGWSRSARRAVEHARAFALGLLEQVRRVEVLAVERRVLAHHDRVRIGERDRRRRRGRLTNQCVLVAGQRDRADRALTRPPRCQTRSRGSHASSSWPRADASRIIAKVVSL